MKITSIVVAAWLVTSDSVEGRLLRRPKGKQGGRNQGKKGEASKKGKKNPPWEHFVTTTVAPTTTTKEGMDMTR